VDDIKKSKIEVGVIGAGGISSAVHLPLLSCMDNVSIKYIADIQDPSDLAKTYKTESVKIDDVTTLPDCDIALLAIPVGVKDAYIQEFSKRKIPIFAEKPFAIDFETHKKFLKLSDKITCNYMKIYYNSIRQIKNLIFSGVLGNLRRVSITEGSIVGGTGRENNSYQSNPKLSGGGILMETGCHTISQLEYIFGDISLRSANVIWEDGFDVEAKIVFDVLEKNSISIDYNITMLKPVENIAEFFFDHSKVSFIDHPNAVLSISSLNSDKHFTLNRETRYAATYNQAYYLKWKSFLDKISKGDPINTELETSIQTTKMITNIYKKSEKI
jgi:predicted dehydrogenase